MPTLHGRMRRRFALIAALAALLIVGPVFAGEFAEGEIYRLAAGQVVEDDLNVSAREVYIDGTVQGDLTTAASYVEINGTIEGDLFAMGAEVRINGVVADDARVGGAGVTVTGSVGDDLYAAAGGGPGNVNISQSSGRSVRQGLWIDPGATIGGAAYLAGGEVTVAGEVAEDLSIAAELATLQGPVGGDANLSVGRLSVGSGAQIAGDLAYSAREEASVPAGVAADVRFTPTPQREAAQAANTASDTFWRVARPILVLLGFALLGWLLLRFLPASLRRPAEALAARPGQAAIYGIAAIAVLFLIPVISGLIFLAVGLFWGWFPAAMFALLLTAALVLAWTLSPLITGLWLGRLVWPKDRALSDLAALVVGALLIVLTSLLPIVGWLVGLTSLVLALGSLILLTRRDTFDAPLPTVRPAPTPA